MSDSENIGGKYRNQLKLKLQHFQSKKQEIQGAVAAWLTVRDSKLGCRRGGALFIFFFFINLSTSLWQSDTSKLDRIMFSPHKRKFRMVCCLLSQTWEAKEMGSVNLDCKGSFKVILVTQ